MFRIRSFRNRSFQILASRQLLVIRKKERESERMRKLDPIRERVETKRAIRKCTRYFCVILTPQRHILLTFPCFSLSIPIRRVSCGTAGESQPSLYKFDSISVHSVRRYQSYLAGSKTRGNRNAHSVQLISCVAN